MPKATFHPLIRLLPLLLLSVLVGPTQAEGETVEFAS